MSQPIDRRRVDDGRYADDRRESRERRKGPDGWVQSLRWFAVLGWGVVLGAFFLVSIAKPRSTTFFARMNNLSMDRAWNMELMYYVFWMLFGGIVIGLLGLVINLMRRRRKHDILYFSLIALAFVSIASFFWVFNL